jgi:hypothetical protein
MANKTVEVLAAEGLTLTLHLYPWGSDTRANGSGDTLTEATNRKGLYSATVTEAITGWHTAHVFNGSNALIQPPQYLYIYSDSENTFRCMSPSAADVGLMNGKRTDGVPSQNDRPALYLSHFNIRNDNNSGIDILTPNGNAISCVSDTEAVWFESSTSAALELQGHLYSLYIASTDSVNGSPIIVTGGNPAYAPISDASRTPFVMNAIRYSKAQAGAASTITLDASASATDNLYANEFITIYKGTGAGQTRRIVSYVGSTQVATVDEAWATNPANDSIFAIHANTAVDFPSGQEVAEAVDVELSNNHGDGTWEFGSVATLLAAGTNVTVTSTVHGNTIEIIRGSSYNTTTGRTIAITIAGDNWPTDLTSWTITMDCMQTHDANHNPVSGSPDSATGVSGTVTQATGDSRAVRIDLTTTITSGLTPGWYKYYIEATNGSNRTTLRTGSMHVVDDDPNS